MDLIGKKKFDFIKNRKMAYIISVVIILVGLISIIFQGFNLGIDFAGGTLIQIRFDKPVSTTEVRNILSEFNLSQSTIQNLSENEFVIRTEKIDSEQRKEILLQKEITISIIAAVLTIIGYSLNNTIVILDRLRENIKFKTREPFENLINMSINQSLSRTINTALTTIIPILTLYFFGGNILSDFALALFIGMVAGTYSSIFIASPLLIEWNKIFKIYQKGTKTTRKKGKK
ncbi:hypothetical protein B6228_01960 [Candidatus Atribacteria bacterium 4572_76]|nr:MAG: hypothetical protein B6228_01960 [Candidatus Atribacteria bacterium 4572_76]